MACFNPRPCWFPPGGGRPHFVDDFIGAHDQREWKAGFVPCRRCPGCLEDSSRAWAIRCVHEAQMHQRKCFLTLTLDMAHLVENGLSVRKRDIQAFMKALRQRFGAGIRFFACGEYGSRSGRAHYHVILFGFDFDDRKLAATSASGYPMYSSKTLDEIWHRGICTVQDLTPETAAYCARYVSKKMDADKPRDERRWRQLPNGKWAQLEPEFLLMSRRPGIGQTWFRRYYRDVYRDSVDGKLLSAVVMPGGIQVAPPPYYDRLIRDASEVVYQKVKDVRREKAMSLGALYEATPARLRARELVAQARHDFTRVGRTAV